MVIFLMLLSLLILHCPLSQISSVSRREVERLSLMPLLNYNSHEPTVKRYVTADSPDLTKLCWLKQSVYFQCKNYTGKFDIIEIYNSRKEEILVYNFIKFIFLVI